MNAYLSSISLRGAPAIRENPLPRFRDQNRNLEMRSDGSVPPAVLEGAGRDMAFRVLPYKMQDDYQRARGMCSIKTVVLENDVLTATFLPEFGGRLYSLYNKRDHRELLFKNPVIQPANLALRDAWLSGGIEWNIGRTGHTYHTCAPVFFQKCKDINGEGFLRMFEYDRCEGLCFQIEFRLPEGSDVLFACVKIMNSRDEAVPMYWWTNIAVRETPGMRILSGTDEVLFLNPQAGGFGLGKMPHLASVPGKDASFPAAFHYSSEYFFQTPKDALPWEAAVYPAEGWIFAEYSTPELPYRKMFTWGTHQGGRKWRDFLSEPGKGDYVEIQAGLGRTQLHGLTMPANAVWTFTQTFTGFEADAKALGTMEYHDASEAMAKMLRREIPAFAPEDESLAEYLSMGSGWGALEQRRRSLRGLSPLPIDFPAESIGDEERPWLQLLLHGKLPENTPSFMIGPDWRAMLEKDSGKEALVHLGVMLCEEGLESEAAAAWEKSLPHPLAYRCLSLAAAKNGDSAAALAYMEQAVALDGSDSYRREYAKLLLEAGEYDRCWALLRAIAEDAPDRLWMLRATAARHTGRWDALEEMLGREYACIREGETILTDLWFAWAEKTGQANQTDPPPHLDFRMK